MAVFVLGQANWEDRKWPSGGEVVSIQRGEFITSIRAIAEDCGVSDGVVKRTLKTLESAGTIERKATNKNTRIRVINFDIYNSDEVEEDKRVDHQTTNERTIKRQTGGPQLRTKELKKVRREEERGEGSAEPDQPSLLAETDSPTQPTAAELIASTAIDRLNHLTGSSYQPTSKATVKLAKALAKAKHTPDQVLRVINAKHAEWWGTDYQIRVCPATLLAASNFEKYIEAIECGAPKPNGSNGANRPPEMDGMRIVDTTKPEETPVPETLEEFHARCARERGEA